MARTLICIPVVTAFLEARSSVGRKWNNMIVCYYFLQHEYFFVIECTHSCSKGCIDVGISPSQKGKPQCTHNLEKITRQGCFQASYALVLKLFVNLIYTTVLICDRWCVSYLSNTSLHVMSLQDVCVQDAAGSGDTN